MARKKYKIPDEQLSMFSFDTPSMPVLDVSRCEAKLINHETAARMAETYHYAHRVPSIVVAVGMYVDEILAGVCTYGIPPSPEARQCCGTDKENFVLELNRLYIYDHVGKNGESWLIGQTFRFIPKEFSILISYADTQQNHIGSIYQATNWLYTGYTDMERKTPRFDYVIPGMINHSRDITRMGGARVANELQAERVERSKKHRYVYFLGSKSQRKELRKALKWPVLPYPKRETT